MLILFVDDSGCHTVRDVKPATLSFGSTASVRENQWFLNAHDLEVKGEPIISFPINRILASDPQELRVDTVFNHGHAPLVWNKPFLMVLAKFKMSLSEAK